MAGRWIGTLVLGVAAGAASGQQLEQHAAHEHGAVTFNIAVEQNTLAVELEAPAINVVGFEHPPRTDEQRKAASDAAALFESGRGLFGVPSAAGCRLRETKVHAPGGEGSPAESGDDGHGAGHRDYRVHVSFNCANPAELVWLELWVLRKLRDVTDARANILTSSKQTTVRVRYAKARLSLR